jgi:hypothetical protein
VLLRYGVNHIDTAARYGDSELRVGAWMDRGHRKDFFLATKTGSRTGKEARDDLHRSLERLRVGYVDLIQMHALWHPDDWDVAMGPDGALEALVDARRQGLARAIGVTGHGWTIAAMHLRSLARFDFDSVLLPYNIFFHENERYRRAFEEVWPSAASTWPFRSSYHRRGPWATSDRTHTTVPASKSRATSAAPSTGHGHPRRLPQHGRGSLAPAEVPGCGQPLHRAALGRGDDGDARGHADDLAVRAARVS